MIPPPASHLPAALILAGLLLAPSFLQAQLTPDQMQAEANRIHDEAMERAHSTFALTELPEIARRHGEAAGLRTVTDPRAFECNRLQARLLFHTGQHEEARAYLERASAVALANGDFVSAATALVGASLVATEAGQDPDAQWLGRMAYLLSEHPSLTVMERHAIRRMISFRTVGVEEQIVLNGNHR